MNKIFVQDLLGWLDQQLKPALFQDADHRSVPAGAEKIALHAFDLTPHAEDHIGNVWLFRLDRRSQAAHFIHGVASHPAEKLTGQSAGLRSNGHLHVRPGPNVEHDARHDLAIAFDAQFDR